MIQHEANQKFKHATICDELRRRIDGGTYAPGDRLPSFADLQAEFDASEDTVVRAYAMLERETLIVRKHRIGTFVAKREPATATDRLKRHGMLGAVIPKSLQRYSYYLRLLDGVQRAATEDDFDVVLMSEAATPRWEKVDGIIFSTPSVHCFPAATPGIPLLPPGMLATSLLHIVPGTFSVVNDDVGGVRALIEHLLSLGHRRIGYLAAMAQDRPGIFESTSVQEARLHGYHQSLGAAGIRPEMNWIRQMVTREDTMYFDDALSTLDHRAVGRNSMRKWLADGWRETGCTALLAQNDLAAIGAIEALREAGIRVPQDISVAGFDGLDIGEYFTPRLTTVEVALEEIAARGTRLLLQQIQRPLDASTIDTEPPSMEPIVVPAKLKVGESTSTVVRKQRRYIA